MLVQTFAKIVTILIFSCLGECMRPNTPTGHQGNADGQASSQPTTSGATTSLPHRINPVFTATARMKPVTGFADPRYAEGYRQIKASSTTKQLKGVSHTGILGNPSSEYKYPKLTLKSGRKEGGIISHFHHPREIPGQAPYGYMQHQQLETTLDRNTLARKDPLNFRKHDRSTPNKRTFEAVREWQDNARHPKASLAYMVPANPSASHKRPRVDVDGGNYHGHLVTLLYGPESPPKQSSRNRSPISGTAAHPSAQEDDDFARSLLRSRTPSPDAGESSKRRRTGELPK
ncbi:uncharacterized protein FA14DRAFT_153861 [Meira miltonrushii]|uniref:Pal1-domain-containing protein n=1 Tax=Meira miltonrushii TaxID=1280837 RepID=A0A316VLY4_9BASI|nr:uncharacterized protein FA14DRAFT_153861 [Meira miltonrushii]PWN38537.1 hypothetical protein FA14DRAFT_153861 [Meira miltonrushii]